MDLKLYNLVKNAQNGPVLSRFLTLDEQANLKSSVIRIVFCNNYEGEERKRAFLSPLSLPIEPDFRICYLLVRSKGTLRHQDLLGALMGLGISRDVIGDLLVKDDHTAYIICACEIEKYIRENLTEVGRSPVTMEPIEQLERTDDPYQQKEIITASMRLDAVIAKVMPASREKAQEFISARAVKVNGTICIDRDYSVKEQDIISIVRWGRIIIRESLRKTKKDKIVLRVDTTK